MEENKKEETNKWEKKHSLGIDEQLRPIANCLLIIIEEEKKRTLEQLEKAKKLLEQMKASR